jgi:hypothetical protein
MKIPGPAKAFSVKSKVAVSAKAWPMFLVHNI